METRSRGARPEGSWRRAPAPLLITTSGRERAAAGGPPPIASSWLTLLLGQDEDGFRAEASDEVGVTVEVIATCPFIRLAEVNEATLTGVVLEVVSVLVAPGEDDAVTELMEPTVPAGGSIR